MLLVPQNTKILLRNLYTNLYFWVQACGFGHE